MKKLLCFDMDGTVNIGNKLIDGAIETFDYLKKNNLNFMFITNNSSKNVNNYVTKMNNLGIECNADNFFTSIELTKLYLQNKNVKSIYLVGTNSFKNEMLKYFNVIEDYQMDACECVVIGFDTELDYKKLETATKYIEDGILYIATNPDLRCPTNDNRFIPDCGSICHLLEDTTGKTPLFLGKPNKEMIKYLCKKEKINLNEVMVIGDRLYTDILVGINAGVDTVAVLTGETSKEEIETSQYKPTYILNSIKELPNLLEMIQNE